MTYTAHLSSLDHAVWSALHSRPWAVTGRQYAALVRLSVLDEWMRTTQREVARQLGYSLKGAHGLVRTGRRGGLLAVKTRRGRYGGTWVRAARGLIAALSRVNVSERSKPSVDRPATPSGNIDESPGMRAWRELGERFKREAAERSRKVAKRGTVIRDGIMG